MTPHKWKLVWHIFAWVAIAALVTSRIAEFIADSGKGSEFPNKAIQIIVPYPAGGGSDTFVRRVIEEGLREADALPVPTAVFNVKGGGGTIGCRKVFAAKPDGYTILCQHNALFSAYLSGTAEFGPNDFAQVAQTANITMVVMVREDSRFKTIGQMIAEAKEKPESVTFGANVGAPAEFTAHQLENTLPGAKFNLVSADGGADRYSRLIGGHLDAGIFSLSEYLDFRDSDDTPADRNVRALVVLSEKRHQAIPNTPTAVEQGIAVTMENAFYWWAPKGTPQDRQDYLANMLKTALDTDIAKQELERLRYDYVFQEREPLYARIQGTLEGFKSVVSVKQTDVPDFSKYVAIIVGALFVMVVSTELNSKGERKSRLQLDREGQLDVSPDSEPESEDFPKRYTTAAACFGVIVAYVLVLLTGKIPFAIGSTLMVFIIGGLMAKWQRPYWLVLTQVALITGFGAEFIFTKLFTVALP